MKSIKNIAGIWWHELRHILGDPGVWLFVIVVPLVYPLLYAFIYNNEVARDVPVAVVDFDDSPLSRDLTRRVDSAPEVRIVARCGSMEEAEELNRRGEIYGIMQIPEEFSARLARGEQATVGVYADMAGMLYYKGLMLAATNVSLELNKSIKVERFFTGATERQEAIATQPIAYDYVALYNPQSGFAAFLLPPVLMLIIQQTLMLGIGMTAGGVREKTRGYAIPLGRTYRNPFHIVAGKTLAYFLYYMLVSAYMYVCVSRMFSLPGLGNALTYFTFMVPYLLACIFMAISFSAFIFRREDCILLYVFMSVPLLFISGISWPGSAVPEFWKAVGYIFPSTFGTNGYVRINTIGASLHDVSREFIILWIQAGVYFMISVMFYRRQIKDILCRKYGNNPKKKREATSQPLLVKE